jgi:hypothetical protein
MVGMRLHRARLGSVLRGSVPTFDKCDVGLVGSDMGIFDGGLRVLGGGGITVMHAGSGEFVAGVRAILAPDSQAKRC